MDGAILVDLLKLPVASAKIAAYAIAYELDITLEYLENNVSNDQKHRYQEHIKSYKKALSVIRAKYFVYNEEENSNVLDLADSIKALEPDDGTKVKITYDGAYFTFTFRSSHGEN